MTLYAYFMILRHKKREFIAESQNRINQYLSDYAKSVAKKVTLDLVMQLKETSQK